MVRLYIRVIQFWISRILNSKKEGSRDFRIVNIYLITNFYYLIYTSLIIL